MILFILFQVISGQCLTERRCGAYVDVEMFGLPADIVRKMYRTKVVQNNTVNPVFDEEPFTFKVISKFLLYFWFYFFPEIALF